MEDAVLGLSDAYVLVRTPLGSHLTYRAESGVSELVERVLVAYREHPLEVVQLLLSHAVGRVRLSIDWLTRKRLKESAFLNLTLTTR